MAVFGDMPTEPPPIMKFGLLKSSDAPAVAWRSRALSVRPSWELPKSNDGVCSSKSMGSALVLYWAPGEEASRTDDALVA